MAKWFGVPRRALIKVGKVGGMFQKGQREEPMLLGHVWGGQSGKRKEGVRRSWIMCLGLKRSFTTMGHGSLSWE